MSSEYRLNLKKTYRCIKKVNNVIYLTLFILFSICGCSIPSQPSVPPASAASDSRPPSKPAETGWTRAQILESEDGPIHYSYYIPHDYNPERTYPLVVAMPGYGEMWFGEDSEGNNLGWNGATVWTELDEDIIVVSAQLTDWQEKSARQAIELTEYMTRRFAVDNARVYAVGYSAGGETMSQAVSLRPDLYAAYIHGASQWDGDYEGLAEERVAVYIFTGENDEYYGSQRAKEAYENLVTAYRQAGYADSELTAVLRIEIPDDAYFNDFGITDYHGGASILFDREDIQDWLLKHKKST